jgi:hypothetical protein
MPWLTKSNDPAIVSRVVYVPDDDEWWADFIGAFLKLTKPENWEVEGTNTPEEMAQKWDDCLRQTQP